MLISSNASRSENQVSAETLPTEATRSSTTRKVKLLQDFSDETGNRQQYHLGLSRTRSQYVTDQPTHDPYYYANWHSGFMQNALLVSQNDLDAMEIAVPERSGNVLFNGTAHQSGVALFNGKPYKVQSSDKVEKGYFLKPPFIDMCNIDKSDEIIISSPKSKSMENESIRSASINIKEVQTDRASSNEVAYIPTEGLISKLHKTLKDVPIINRTEQYYCSANAYLKGKNEGRNQININLIFSIEYAKETYQNSECKIFTIDDKTHLELHTDLNTIDLIKAPEKYWIVQERQFHGMNKLYMNNSQYELLNLNNMKNSIIKINGRYFSVVADDFVKDSKELWCNASLLKHLCFDQKYPMKVIHEQLPTASKIHLKIEMNEDNKNGLARSHQHDYVIKLKQDLLPTADLINLTIKEEINNIPLQKNTVLDLLIPLGNNSYTSLKATVDSVYGESEDHLTASNALLGSDNTEILFDSNTQAFKLTKTIIEDKIKNSLYKNWDKEYENNVCLISKYDNKGINQYHLNNSIVLLNGTPHKVAISDKIEQGHIAAPPFFKLGKNDSETITLSPCQRGNCDIKKAMIHISKIHTDIILNDNDKIEVSYSRLSYEIKKSLANIPLNKGESYYCHLPMNLVDEYNARTETNIKLEFSIKNSIPELEDDSDFVMLISAEANFDFDSSQDGNNINIVYFPDVEPRSKQKSLANTPIKEIITSKFGGQDEIVESIIKDVLTPMLIRINHALKELFFLDLQEQVKPS